jgi:predicted phage tail protein
MNIRLHGFLGKKFGENWELDVGTPAEAFKALDANTEDFWKYLQEKDLEGVRYLALADNKPLRISQEIELSIKDKEVLNIVPIIKGAGIFDMETPEDVALVGVLTAVLGFGLGYIGENFIPEGFFQDLALTLADIAFDVGMAMITSGLMGMLMEAPSVDSSDIDITMPDEAKGPEAKNTTSFVFSRPLNNTTQGAPVPIGYGRLRVGSNVISSSLLNCRITPFPSMTEDLIDEGGNTEGAISVDQFSSTTSAGALAPLTDLEISNVINSETIEDTDAIVKVKDGDGNTKSSSLIAFNAALNELDITFDESEFTYGGTSIRGINELWNTQEVKDEVESQNNG